ncbi:GGDEF domain-containing protein [Paractinoplanes abujensis]|uniref:Diguanylate cyclase (GGDEF)-like protein n=1 Tax=Paractinoplanes abujensis TaxID=882441 RepID=A0A7W7CUM9_9ACTN|nr:GGDEF domain-containing protein [Actinoplanes abujensis]MBB4693603.1 diguanylate cyclase (GGDEF)-like protein [Actinoplanes abujensis]
MDVIRDYAVRARARWWRADPDPLLMWLAAGTAALVALYAADVASAGVQVVGAWVFVAVIHVGLAFVARSTARMPGLPAPTRRFWRSVAAAGVVYLVGDLAQVLVAVRDPSAAVAATGGTVQVVTLAAGSALLMVTLLTVPLGFGSRRERTRFWLDVATVMVAAVVVGWYLVVPERPAALLQMAAPVLAGPMIILLCVFVVAKLVMSGTAPFTRLCGLIGAGGAALKSGADALGRDGLSDGRLHWFLACTVAAHALLTIALRVNQRRLAVRPEALQPRPRKPYSLLPYGSIAVTYVLLTIAVVRDEPVTVAVGLAGAAISTVLVVLRQLTAFRDNARLLAELDAKVRELHLTQEGLHASLAERDALAARLRHHALHDSLTGLPNRVLYAERLDAALAQGRAAVAMLIDLDGFKQVNDERGHAAGDHVLREVARRVQGSLRGTDTVARIGGDEFAVLVLPEPGDDLHDIAARIIRTVETPVAVEGGTARVGASVGIAVATEHTESGDALLRAADRAMYEVKRDGKGSYALAPAH